MRKLSEQLNTGRCEHCGKFAFFSRRAAKRYAANRFPGVNMSVYPCKWEPEYYHFGHKPVKLKTGDSTRDSTKKHKKEWVKPIDDYSNED